MLLPHLASSLNSFSRCGQTSSIRASWACSASLAVDITWFFSSSDTSISWILTAVWRKRWRRGRLEGSKTRSLWDSSTDGMGWRALLIAMPLELFWALMGAEAGAIPLEASLFVRGSGRGALAAAATSRKSCSSGAKSLASTSLRRVKWRTSSLGRAVTQSAKWVIAGKMSMGWSPPIKSLPAPERPRVAVLREGFVRAWRAGCDRRCDRLSAGDALADFIVGDAGRMRGLRRSGLATQAAGRTGWRQKDWVCAWCESDERE